jgi:lysophospholipase L1-like esterase
MGSIKKYLILSLMLSFSFIKAFDGIPNESTYCATWASSQYLTETNNLPPIPLSNNSIRQIVHVSISSPTIRLKFSNRVGDSNLELKAVTLANSLSQGSGEIDTLTLTKLTFSGKESVVIPPYSEIYSDPFYYPLKTQSEVAISIYFGEVPEKLTSHAGSRTFSFFENGNKVNEQKFSHENKVAHWYVITAIEVSHSFTRKAVICYGDSITDGRGSTDDKQNRWSDVLSKKLYLNDETINVAVVNEGIGATMVRAEGQERFDRDVINVKGSTYIIVLYGVNDIIFNDATAEQVTDAYKALIRRAHRNNKFIYGGTILPFSQSTFWSEEKEKVRKEVNNWIRTTRQDKGGFDYFFDFDEVTKDPNDEKKLFYLYDSGDGLHLSPDGYIRMVDAIDNLKLFTLDPNFEVEKYVTELVAENKVAIKYNLGFELKKGEDIYVRIKGKSEGSVGFRILTNDKYLKKSSNYYYTERLGNGPFDYSTILTAKEDSEYIIIRRPISTINIDKITITSLEFEFQTNKTVLDPSEGVFLE